MLRSPAFRLTGAVVLGGVFACVVPVACGSSGVGTGGTTSSGAGGFASSTSGSSSASGIGLVGSGGPGSGGSSSSGCPDASDAMVMESPDAAKGCEGAQTGIHYAADIGPIFAQSCNGEQCHSTPTRATLVSKPAYECCDGRLLVAPGDPDYSYLVDKLNGVQLCSGSQMPLASPMLPDAQISAIIGWICAGALDD